MAAMTQVEVRRQPLGVVSRTFTYPSTLSLPGLCISFLISRMCMCVVCVLSKTHMEVRGRVFRYGTQVSRIICRKDKNLLNHHTSPHVIFLSNKQNHSVMYSQKYCTSDRPPFTTFNVYFSDE